MTTSSTHTGRVLHSNVPVPDTDGAACEGCHSTRLHGRHLLLPDATVGETQYHLGEIVGSTIINARYCNCTFVFNYHQYYIIFYNQVTTVI